MAAKLSIDNGNNYYAAIEIMDLGGDEGERLDDLMPAIVDRMGNDLREDIHTHLADQCSEREFLARYLEQADEDLVIG